MGETKNLKEVLDFAMSLHMAYEAANADGKIDLMDAGLLTQPVMKLIPAIEEIKKVGEEVKNLSSEDRAEMEQWLKATYDIADDKLEMKVEKGLALALHIAEFVGAL